MLIKSLVHFISLFLLSSVAFSYELPKRYEINETCKAFIEEIKSDYEFGWIEVPREIGSTVFVDEKKTDKVYVFYYFLRRTTSDRLKNPILFFNGGPGFSSHGQQRLLNTAASKLAPTAQYDFIFMDQRGTGCSSPMPYGSSLETMQSLRSWMSFAHVTDAEILRKHLLGDRKWKVLGQSFGAYIAFRYLELFPQGLAKVFTHGNALGLSDFERSYNRIYSQYRVTELFNKKHPDSKKKLALLKIFLSDPKQCFKNSLRDYCGYEITTHFIFSLGYVGNWNSLATWLKLMVPSNSVSLEGVQTFVDRFITNSEFYYRESEDPEQMGDRLNIALNLFGMIDWDSRPLTASQCAKIYSTILKKNKLKPEALVLDECQAPLQFNFEDKIEPFVKKVWPDLTPKFIDPTTVLNQIKLFKVPVYSYSGDADCYVPVESFVTQNKIFGKLVSYTKFVGSGHDGFATEKKVFDDMK